MKYVLALCAFLTGCQNMVEDVTIPTPFSTPVILVAE